MLSQLHFKASITLRFIHISHAVTADQVEHIKIVTVSKFLGLDSIFKSNPTWSFLKLHDSIWSQRYSTFETIKLRMFYGERKQIWDNVPEHRQAQMTWKHEYEHSAGIVWDITDRNGQSLLPRLPEQFFIPWHFFVLCDSSRSVLN